MKYRHLFIFLFLYLWIFLGLYLAQAESPTFDEPVHLKAAIQYERGDYNFDPIEPPLWRRFVYGFGRSIETVTGPSPTLFPYRAVVVITTGILFSIILWPVFTHSVFGGLLASVLLVYEPNLMAHSHYFTTDAVSAIMATMTALFLLTNRWKTTAGILLFGLLLSLTVSLKVATIALLAPLMLIKSTQIGKRRLTFLVLFAFLFIWSTYDFRSLPIFGRFPIELPLGGYLRAVKENLLFSLRGQPIYFLGEIYSHAPWYKTIFVLLLKNTLPLLLLSFWALKETKKKAHLVIIILLVLLIGISKPLNFGMRHLLSAQVAIVLLASKVSPKSLFSWMIFTLLIIWQISAFRLSLPQLITYTNELNFKSHAVFTDSDVDWGQGLVILNQEIKSRGIYDYQLAYFGNIDTAGFLGYHTRIKDHNPADNFPIVEYDVTRPAIISFTCYYLCGYSTDPLFAYRDKEIIAQSFYYFK